jgi:hypothetical protein
MYYPSRVKGGKGKGEIGAVVVGRRGGGEVEGGSQIGWWPVTTSKEVEGRQGKEYRTA